MPSVKFALNLSVEELSLYFKTTLLPFSEVVIVAAVVVKLKLLALAAVFVVPLVTVGGVTS